MIITLKIGELNMLSYKYKKRIASTEICKNLDWMTQRNIYSPIKGQLHSSTHFWGIGLSGTPLPN